MDNSPCVCCRVGNIPTRKTRKNLDAVSAFGGEVVLLCQLSVQAATTVVHGLVPKVVRKW
jgi:hypothetical protein